MSQMEDALGALLSNPQMMQQLMSVAQSLSPPQQEAPKKQEAPPSPPFDPRVLQSLAGLAGKGSMDNDQQTLLAALEPYLSRERVSKLERAMRAAKLAGAASAFLNAGGLQMLTGR